MKKDEYRMLLDRLPIANPTLEDMALVCPHITPEQAIAALTDGKYIACPSLRVRNAFQILSFSKGYTKSVTIDRVNGGEIDASVTGTKEIPPYLHWSFTGRTPESYATNKNHGDVFSEYLYTKEAISFANQNWGDDLVLDNWIDVINYQIQDPSDLYKEGMHRGCPKTKAVLYIAINRPWNELINDRSKPLSKIIDDAIVEITDDPAVGCEIKGGRGGYTQFNCAYCGYGLNLTRCKGCGHEFRDDNFRTGWTTPLSLKMTTLLQKSGSVFKKDPQFAWELEAEQYEALKKQAEERKARQDVS